MITLINGNTGKPVNVPEELVERFRAAGFQDPAAPEPKPEPRKAPSRGRRITKPE